MTIMKNDDNYDCEKRSMDNVNRISLVEQVTDVIRNYIDAEDVQVGDKMPSEAALCRLCNVSRTTVRESLRLLQAMGYVSLVPNKGAFVADKNRSSLPALNTWLMNHGSEASDVYEVRMILETRAAGLAAERATAEEKYMLMGIHAMFVEEARKENLAGIVLYDEKFHECIMKASHNSFIVEINKLISDTLRSFRRQSFAEETSAQLAVDMHGKLAGAIMNGDAVQAKNLMRQHLETNVHLIEQFRKKRE
ncbi:MAG: FadR family transcriptional regulator [Lachnospiraceae bacterium]|nr:FadR family transcriptional regulator [Lachnospiraceae bacterium]